MTVSKKRRIFLCTTIFSSSITILMLLLKIYISLSFIPDISGSETSTILPVQRLHAGLPIYTDPEKPAFLITQYTPIYFVIVSSVVKLSKLATSDVHKVFIVSRLVSTIFTCLSVFVVWIIIYNNTQRNRFVAFLGAGFIYQILSFWFLTSSRPDSLLVYCTSLFIYAAFKAFDHEKPDNIWWFAALFFAVTAFFVKQSGAIHSVSLGLFCIMQSRWSLLGRLVCFGFFLFAAYLAILPIPNLNIFFLNIVGGVANSTSWDWFYDWTLQKLLFQFAPFLAVNFVIVFFCLKNEKPGKTYFLAICCICFFLFAIITAFKIGAGVGYFQDYLIVAVILLVLFLINYFKTINVESSFATYVGCIYLCLVALHCLLFVFTSYTSYSLESYKNKYIEQRDVAVYLKTKKKLKETDLIYVCGIEDFNGYYLNHFLYQNILIPFSDIVFLADKNKSFDFNQFRELVKVKEIKYVVSGKGKVPVTILGQGFSGLIKIHSTVNLDIYQGY